MIIIAILILATFLRFFDLENLPIALFGDEVDVGYHALSLWTTGRDYMGHFLPTYIQTINEWRAPLLMYVSAPFVGVLGPSNLSVRIAPAIFGVASIYLVYLLTNLLLKDYKFCKINAGHIAAIILTVTPWHIHYSRMAFESTLLLFLLLLGTYLFLKKHYLLSVFPFILTFYTYSTANLFTPLLIAALFLVERPKFKTLTLKPFALGLILILPIAYHLTLGQAAGRFNMISIFNDTMITDQVVLSRTQPWVGSQNLDRLFINKFTLTGREFINNYLQSFSPQFLFTNGDPYFRHSISNFGELLLVFLPFLILGFVKTITSNNKSSKLITTWLFIAPIGAALTQSGGMHATRLFVMLPPLTWLITAGIFHSFHWLKNNYPKVFVPFSLLLITLAMLNMSAYWYSFSVHYRSESSGFYDLGFSEIFNDLKENQDNYKKIYINNIYQPVLVRFLFYTNYSPAKFQKEFITDIPDENLTDLFSGFKLEDKYYFGQIKNTEKISELLNKDTLYLAVQGDEIPGDWDWTVSPPEGVKAISFVKNIYQQPLFYLLTAP
jgi:4-amino-4-deoxy-L-arabinose transferase-like glycosyltransferase